MSEFLLLTARRRDPANRSNWDPARKGAAFPGLWVNRLFAKILTRPPQKQAWADPEAEEE
jgi:hypothetical protein